MKGRMDTANVETTNDDVILPILQVGYEQAFSPEETVYILTRYLAGRCDGAREQDGVGFNKLHTDFGKKLAEIPFNYWSQRQLWAAYKMLRTYKNTQLAEYWDVVPEIAEPPKSIRQQEYEQYKQRTDTTFVPEERFRRLVMTDVDGERVVEIQHNYDPVLVERVKDLPQRKWIPERKCWIVPVQYDTLEAIASFASEYGYDIDPEVETRFNDVMDSLKTAVELSHAKDGDYHVELPEGLELYPFQRVGVQYAEKVGNVLIADQMGLGKTVQGLLTIDVTNAFPAIVVVPASGKYVWAREATKWIPKKRVAMLSSRKAESLTNGKGVCPYDVLIVNYDVLDAWKESLIMINPKALIADECHKVKNPNSTRHKAVKTIIEAVPSIRRIFLSGTPVVNRPMEFWTLIKLLGYGQQFGGAGEYARRYDNEYKDRLQELNTRARSHFMIRRMKADVLPELPEKQRITVPIDIDNRTEYKRAEQDIAGYFATKTTQTAEYNQVKLDYTIEAIENGFVGEEAKKFIQTRMQQAFGAEFARAYAIASRNEELLRWEALKQLAVKGKMNAVEAWIDEFLESDEKLVVFASHTHIVERIARRYKAPYIRGDVKAYDRDQNVLRFQTDPSCRVIVGNINAMGEIVTLHAASNVVFCEFGWNPKDHDQAEDRLHRIGQKDNVTVWNLVAEATIDEEVCALIERKRLVTDAIQDGAGLDIQREMMDALRASLEARVSKRR